MGLIASIYKDVEWERNGTDCSNDGISNRFTKVTIVNAEGPFEPRPDAPAVAVIEGYVEGAVIAVPVDEETEPNARKRGMMGGTFIHTSDSRLGDLIKALTGNRGDGIVPFHDRYEE